jgi:epoxyqueuosine reductase
MPMRRAAERMPTQPSPEVQRLWPAISGNTVNGLGDDHREQPRAVFWRTDGSISHGDVQYYFYGRDKDNPRIAESRKYREATAAIPVSDIATEQVEKTPEDWAAAVKAAARDCGADDAGICLYRPEWTFNDRPQPRGKWVVAMAFAHDYDNMRTAPHEKAYIEVMAQYARAGGAAKHLANWIREQGYFAEGKTGPNTEDVLMIPAAIEAGLGELGKHGSMIHKKFGSNFRLSLVLTDLPLVPDAPDPFGADEFCASCQVCVAACPPDAIFPEKQIVRGERKWYVDFDKCVPYFVDNQTCGICLAVCPWSRPGIAENLLAKLARRRAGRANAAQENAAE